MKKAIIERISGPVVEASGLASAQMYEVAGVGPLRLVGEVVKVEHDKGTIQVYENTSGLKPGDEIHLTGHPLSLTLGPGLIGNIYDGVQRPLPEIARQTGSFIGRGQSVPALDGKKKWSFEPRAKVGDSVSPGQILGQVQVTSLITHYIMIPPNVEGKLTSIADKGDYTVNDEVANVETRGKPVSVTMSQTWPVRTPRPFQVRKAPSIPLITGMRIIDALFPIAKGGSAAVPGGFGTGKTMTQHSLAKWSDADIIVYVGCGERGNEMTQVLTDFKELVDPRSGKKLMERTVLIANTSNMPVAAREVSIYTGITIAEYFRDMGYHVAVMADSTSRWAEALREMSSRLEEMPAEEGFPAHLPTRLAHFYERGGMVRTLNDKDASISIIGSVSPPGGDFSEPVTQHTKRFIRCFWALSTELANARHYPSIDWLESYSEYADDIADWWQKTEPDWVNLRNTFVEILQKESRLQQIVKLVGPDVLPQSQRLILFVAELIKNGFLQQNAFDEVDMFCKPQKQVFLMKMILEIYHRGEQLITKGVPLYDIRSLDCIEKVVRAKSEIKNDDTDALQNLFNEVSSQLSELERRSG